MYTRINHSWTDETVVRDTIEGAAGRAFISGFCWWALALVVIRIAF